MRWTLLFPLTLLACAPAKPDSKALSRTYLSAYVNNVQKPPTNAFYNGHPAAEIRVDYELTRPGENPTRHTTLVPAYENITVGPADKTLTIIRTDFTDPFYRSEQKSPAPPSQAE